MATTVPARTEALPRVATSDGVFVMLSIGHAALLLTAPSIPLIAIAMWWNANTISHNFIHRPFFRSKAANRAYSIFLSLVLGIPQSLWRARHLAHHSVLRESTGGAKSKVGQAFRPAILGESSLIGALWAAMLAASPSFALTVYAPGLLLGLGLCFLQGHFEHARGTTSHYGRIYNALFFNDGYHVEHHERPGVHWSELPVYARAANRRSSWPPVLRWLDACNLDTLERLVLQSPRLQRFVLARHEQAFRRLLPMLDGIRRITIVGGGLFPRTALILETLLPGVDITIVDVNAAHLACARTFLGDRVRYRCEWYDSAAHEDADLVVIPLAFSGNRGRIYQHPPAPAVIVHDWIGARHAQGTIVSWLLLKRLNLVQRLVS